MLVCYRETDKRKHLSFKTIAAHINNDCRERVKSNLMEGVI